MEDRKEWVECLCEWPEHAIRLVTLDFAEDRVYVDFAISSSCRFRDRLKEAWNYLWGRNHLSWREVAWDKARAEQIIKFLQETIANPAD